VNAVEEPSRAFRRWDKHRVVPPRLPLLAALCALLVPAADPAVAQPPVADPGGRLVYVFSLDGLDGDRVDQGRAPFLSRLLRGEAAGARATYYKESRSVMVAETNPNHVAMATGAFADRSGIPGNAFAVYGEQARRDCAADEDGTTDGEVATCLIAETFFATAKRLAPERTVTAGIFGKPKLADLFAGRRVDPNAFDADFLWSPCVPAARTPYCDPTAPARPNDGYAVADRTVMDTLLQTVRDGVATAGGRARPNLTFANLPTIDSSGHLLGTQSGAYDAAIGEADAQLERFVAAQQAAGLWDRTVMFVVSDHAMETTLGKTTLASAFGSDGDGTIVSQNGSVDMVYLEDRAAPGRFAKLKALRAKALAQRGVDEALYREPNPLDGGIEHTLDFVHPGWRVAGERTGDLFVTHHTEGAFSDPVNPLVGNHGSSLTADNMFAVVGGDPAVVPQTVGGIVGPRFDDTLLNPGSAQNVDLAPTVMALLGLEAPAQSEGRVLTEAFRPGTFAPPATAPSAVSCLVPAGYRAVRATPRGRGLRITVPRRATVDLLRQTRGRTILAPRRIKRFTRAGTFTWSGRGASSGVYLLRVRFPDVERRIVLLHRRGRFVVRPQANRAPSCRLLTAFDLSRPAFGGTRTRSLSASFTVRDDARVFLEVLRGRKVVRRYPPTTRRAGTHRVLVAAKGLRRGEHKLRLTATAGATKVVAILTARRL
jgi:hypothetical protein